MGDSLSSSPVYNKLNSYDPSASVDEAIHVESRPSSVIRRDPPELIKNLSPEMREELEKRLVRKVDLRLLPTIVVMYIMNYLDRNNIASARLQGLQADLKLSDPQYQLCVSILFVGYITFQVPSNLLLNKLGKPAIYLPAVMIVWGIISTATAAARSFSDLIAIRLCLGIVEAAYFPGCLYFLSSWYTRKELSLRTALLYSGSLLSGAFSGLIAAGILDGLQGVRGISSWRWLFIIEGSVTIGLAGIAFFILPNLPRTTSWLTEEEKQLAWWRLDEDIGEDDWTGSSDQPFWHGFKLALSDSKTWILALMFLCIISSSSVTNFFPTVVQTLPGNGPNGHVTSIQALLLTCPPYILGLIVCLTNAWHADRTGERYWHITAPLYIAVIAFIIAATRQDFGPRYLAIMLMIPGIYAGYVVALGWISNCIPRPPAKRAVALAFINAVSNSSSIYASFMYVGGPAFVVPFSVDCVTAFVALLSATALRFMLVRLNKKLDRGERVDGMGGGFEAAATKGFRFLY